MRSRATGSTTRVTVKQSVSPAYVTWDTPKTSEKSEHRLGSIMPVMILAFARSGRRTESWPEEQDHGTHPAVRRTKQKASAKLTSLVWPWPWPR
jgi:predicted RNA polymerase sigma factor